MNVATELKHIESTHRENMNFRHYTYLVEQAKDENSDLYYSLKKFQEVIDSKFDFGFDVGRLNLVDVICLGVLDGEELLQKLKSNENIKAQPSGLSYKESVNSICYSLACINEYFDTLKKLGCPKYRIDNQLDDVVNVMKYYFLSLFGYHVAKLSRQEMHVIERVYKELLSYPD